jgi:trimethylamine--corrinoid protein Co-methyltransferase
MAIQRPPLEPIKATYRVQYLSDEQLSDLQEATLWILEEVGVKFPSEKALEIFDDHGARVDHESQIVKLSREMVRKAMATVPRTFNVGSRVPEYDFHLEEGVTYFCTDGCGVETVDWDTREMRPSCKEDVARTARIVDYLSSMAFYWPMVSAQDYGKAAPLHELDAAWNNTVKHVQSETLMGAESVKFGLEMATVIAGDREELRRRPNFSVIICTIAPLVQDKEGIEGAMVLAEAGVPVGFLAMPTIGSTAPAALAGAFAVGDAEVISATVLMQLINPGAPVCHSLMQAWTDPRTGRYLAYPTDARCRFGPVDIAHHWGMPAFGGAFGTESAEPGTWQSAADVALDPLLISMAGAEWVTGIGLNRSFTLLYPEGIILDDELYHRARFALMDMEVSEETLALEVIQAVGPGGHYLAQKHTRKHLKNAVHLGLTHQMDEDSQFRDPVEVAREKVKWILENHEPEPLEAVQQKELARILKAAEKELG